MCVRSNTCVLGVSNERSNTCVLGVSSERSSTCVLSQVHAC
jgi:hypothetical protein